MRTIGVVTTSRADYSSLLPVLKTVSNESELNLMLFVGGMHLASEFGFTVKEIEADGFPIADRIEMLLASDSGQAIAKSMGLGVLGFADSMARLRPDILVVVGDRFELLGAVSTALALSIPIAHISGGDVTEGAIDNQVRLAISKMSHVHFVAMPLHANRLIQMGEEAWRVFVTGDPALDLIRQMKFLTRTELEKHLDLNLQPPVLLITYHPTTLSSKSVLEEVNTLLDALSRIKGTCIFTCPNADSQNQIILDRIREFVAFRSRAKLFFNLGQLLFYSLLNQVDIMLGNSSSGIWEAPSFRLPVVNIGDRQRGRLRTANVIDAECNADAIYHAIQQGITTTFRVSLKSLENPYGDGRAASRIVNTLKELEPGMHLLRKKFVDLSVEEITRKA